MAFESNEPIADCPKDVSDRNEREYNSLLSQSGIEDPRKLNENVCQNNLTTWPNIDLGDIFHYILETKAFGTDCIGKYKASTRQARCSLISKAYMYIKF